MNKRLILLTNTWPFDSGETFLETEVNYLSEVFEQIEVFPLYTDTNIQRKAPANFTIHKPALKRNPKHKASLITSGIFSCAPLWFAVKEFFKAKCYTSGAKLWNLCTETLTFRASYPTLKSFPINPTDIVYSYWGYKWSASLPFIKKRSGGCTCVSRFHGGDLYEDVTGYIPFRAILFNSLDAAFPISESGAEYIKKNYKFNGMLQVSRLGVAEESENPAQKEDALKIISCSNAIPVKRVDLIARALPFFKQPVQWTHIGDGPTLESIKAMCLGQNVKFMGRRSNQEVKQLYATEHFDLFINVSSSEGVPVSIMEAFAQGIPVIATNVGGTGEIVDSTVGALLPANLTPEMLAKAITEFCQADTTQIRKNAKERWNNMCNADENYKAFTHLLTALPSFRTERGGYKL